MGLGKRLGPGTSEQELKVAAQVIEAGGSDLRTLLRFGKDEGSLNDGLRVVGKAFDGPVGADAVLLDGCLDVGDQRGSVRADAAVARFADGGMGFVNLLNHGAEQTGVLRKLTPKDRFAEVHVAEKAFERVRKNLIGSRGEDAFGKGGEMLRGGQRQVFFAREVMKEAALGEAGSLADVLNARGGIPLGANDIEGGIEDSCPGIVMSLGQSGHRVPTSRYHCTN